MDNFDHLTPEQRAVLFDKKTEAPYSGKYYAETADGVYVCVACGNTLFSSDTKYDAHCGWPSFWAPAAEQGSVEYKPDTSHGMRRTEVVCAKCGGHLGHVFADGPADKGGQRYCINSAALHLKKKE